MKCRVDNEVDSLNGHIPTLITTLMLGTYFHDPLDRYLCKKKKNLKNKNKNLTTSWFITRLTTSTYLKNAY